MHFKLLNGKLFNKMSSLVVECLPSRHETLGSLSVSTMKKEDVGEWGEIERRSMKRSGRWEKEGSMTGRGGRKEEQEGEEEAALATGVQQQMASFLHAGSNPISSLCCSTNQWSLGSSEAEFRKTSWIWPLDWSFPALDLMGWLMDNK